MCPLAVLLLQCRSILCLHPNILSLWCFYRESLLLRWSLLVCPMLLGFVPSSLCEWNQRPWTFNTHKIPKEIKIEYQKLNVEPYIPNPLRCYKCLGTTRTNVHDHQHVRDVTYIIVVAPERVTNENADMDIR